MNEKNSLGLDKCFLELDNPILLFTEWYKEAKKTEINDPNALALGTIDNKGYPNVRMYCSKTMEKMVLSFTLNLIAIKENL